MENYVHGAAVDWEKTLIAALPHAYYQFEAGISAGVLRAGELLALRWEAVDFERLCMKVKEGVVNGESVRSRLNTQKTNCHWIQTSQRYSLRSNGSRTGPVCCFRVPLPAFPTMLLQSSRTTSAARGGVLLRVPIVVLLPEPRAPEWIRSVETSCHPGP